MPPPHRNGLRWTLLAEDARALYGDAWEYADEQMVGMFRLAAGRHPHDGRLADIVADLGERSALSWTAWWTRCWAASTPAAPTSCHWR
ncbi:hypothetical protein ACFQZ8_01075 [Micromonospora azadirachtae]|uniref:MmyB-like transcription regulator ligand binding domain-containing protein n=1 Tax=Micromonospora azadirachtae TaxID=1970735 RepID=A0ABW2ZVA9_9ACTN